MLHDVDMRMTLIRDQVATLARSYDSAGRAGLRRAEPPAGSARDRWEGGSCGKPAVSPVFPSQQPSLNRHAGHCQVPWTQRISEPQRQQVST